MRRCLEVECVNVSPSQLPETGSSFNRRGTIQSSFNPNPNRALCLSQFHMSRDRRRPFASALPPSLRLRQLVPLSTAEQSSSLNFTQLFRIPAFPCAYAPSTLLIAIDTATTPDPPERRPHSSPRMIDFSFSDDLELQKLSDQVVCALSSVQRIILLCRIMRAPVARTRPLTHDIRLPLLRSMSTGRSSSSPPQRKKVA